MNNIEIAIIGTISVGKSTILNGFFTDTISQTARKRTTMLPQKYLIHNALNTNTNDAKKIYETNLESNKNIIEKRESNTFEQNDFTTINHRIGKINDFIDLKNNTYSIIDTPGLNDQGSEIYYDYIKKISRNIDIYIMVFDINSSLNTTDEIKVLDFVVEQIKQNKYGQIHIILNKCDDFEYNPINGLTYDVKEDEMKELLKQAEDTIKGRCAGIMYKITPLKGTQMYVFRTLKYNPKSEIMIPEKDLDAVIKNEFGVQELRKLQSHTDKKNFIIKNSVKKYDQNMNLCGFTLFKKNMMELLCEPQKIVQHHVLLSLEDINNSSKTTVIAETIKKITKFKQIIFAIDLKFSNIEPLSQIIYEILSKFIAESNSSDELYKFYTLEEIDKIINVSDSIIINLANFKNCKNFSRCCTLSIELKNVYKNMEKKILLNIFRNEYDENVFLRLLKLFEWDFPMNEFITCIDNTMIITNITNKENDNKKFEKYLNILSNVFLISKKNEQYIEYVLKQFHKLYNIPKEFTTLYIDKFINSSQHVSVEYLWYSYKIHISKTTTKTTTNNNETIELNCEQYKFMREKFITINNVLHELYKIDFIDINTNIISKYLYERDIMCLHELIKKNNENKIEITSTNIANKKEINANTITQVQPTKNLKTIKTIKTIDETSTTSEHDDTCSDSDSSLENNTTKTIIINTPKKMPATNKNLRNVSGWCGGAT